MLEKTWRWFGSDDPVRLAEIRQTGTEGIVTALHHIPNGEVWPISEILRIKLEIEKHNMTWSVVESLPVHEEIKYAGPNRDKLIENYKESLVNLGKCGLDTVCYNFMPVIDWIRTDLEYKLENGAGALFFNFVEFIIFDRIILNRKEAANEYPAELVAKAQAKYSKMSQHDINRLIDTIIIKTQGFIDGITADDPQEAVHIFKGLLANYKNVDVDQLRQNLKYFLAEIIPVAEKEGIKMSIHPDDPPMPVLGLPRIVSSVGDIQWIMDAIPSPSNGLTFCAGSLSAGDHNDLEIMTEQFAHKIFFAHLRSTQMLNDGNFYEANHLSGSANLHNILKLLLKEQHRRGLVGLGDRKIPMRVDHGHKLLSDFEGNYHPGYPLIGRLKAMAEITGLEMGILQNVKF